MNYLLAWKHHLRDWEAIERNDEWTFGNILYKSIGSAQEAALRELCIERIEYRTYNQGTKVLGRAMTQPTMSPIAVAFFEMTEESEG